MRHLFVLTFCAAFAGFMSNAMAQSDAGQPDVVVNWDVIGMKPPEETVTEAKPIPSPVEEAEEIAQPAQIVAPPMAPAEVQKELSPVRALLAKARAEAQGVKPDEPVTAIEMPPPQQEVAAPVPVEQQPARKKPALKKVKDKVAEKEDTKNYKILFAKDSDALKFEDTATLDKIIARINKDAALKLQMQAYADGTPETAASARRLSLSRALKVREYLVQKNMAPTRLDVRAMGSGSADMDDKVNGKQDADRVDITLVR